MESGVGRWSLVTSAATRSGHFSRPMKTAALVANCGLLVALIVYLVTGRGIELEVRELPLFGLMLVAPILSILSLVKKRAVDGPRKQQDNASCPTEEG